MSVLVIGIGNPDRGDDALGLRVIDLLRDPPPPGAELITAGGDMLRVMDLMQDRQAVILVDAMRAGKQPGEILRLDVSTAPVTDGLESFASTHAFNLAETIELARNLGRLPPRLTVYGVEAADFTPGAEPGPVVARALPEVARRIREEIACTKLP
jgi:hydrogenase maturation protease